MANSKNVRKAQRKVEKKNAARKRANKVLQQRAAKAASGGDRYDARVEYRSVSEMIKMRDKMLPYGGDLVGKRVPFNWNKRGCIKEHQEYFADTLEAKDIIVPDTVEQFRDNLLKYYTSTHCDERGWCIIAFQQRLKGCYSVPVSKLNCLGDLYDQLGAGFSGDGTAPVLIPLITKTVGDDEYKKEAGLTFGVWGYYSNPDNFELVTDSELINGITEGSVCLVEAGIEGAPIDSQHWREFFGMTLGEYSGYGFPPKDGEERNLTDADHKHRKAIFSSLERNDDKDQQFLMGNEERI